ncbi:1,2-phenylacetyl-CoA epoxidase subunit PaaD [Euzebya tangerina]|uniref:1,2-phenylacetyl-CoA epoxidase subunit PaaD n=1 Tax=Euzebya tangerina TaxID=591198 RepID=UPI0013C34CE3|nr:1,2-phenylacetyl-CoA epoxidase subunit PaaD [Euzebya tangerina]
MSSDVVNETAILEEVRAAVAGVEDPEMQPITVGELGMLVEVSVDGPTAVVDIMPTFTGCPATAYIGADVEQAAVAVEGIDRAVVRWRRDLSWGPERITEAGRIKLAETGIAPPGSGQTQQNSLLGIGGVRCPYCGSRNTRADSPFGSAPCRSTHSCRDCKTPFDAIKPI